jgi:hypothetical protein
MAARRMVRFSWLFVKCAQDNEMMPELEIERPACRSLAMCSLLVLDVLQALGN